MSRRTAYLGRARWQSATFAFALSTLQIGCGDDVPAVASSPPAAPATNDPSFAVRAPGWLLVGNALTPGQDELAIRVVAPSGTGHVDAFVADLPGVRLSEDDG